MGWSREIEDIHAKRKAALEQGGAEAVARQHAQGRLTVRERIDGLVDPGSFREHGRGAGGVERNADGTLKSITPANFIVGMGRIDGRLAVVGGEDFTVRGGSPNAAGLRKSVYIEDLALQYRVPLIRLHEGGGGSVTGAAGGGPVGEPLHTPRRFASVAECMGAVPVATAALGPVAGLPASRLVAAHFAVMTKENAQVLIAGPAVVKRALGEDVTKEELGGAQVHARSGAIDNIAEDEADALAQIRHFLSYLPQNAWQVPARVDTDDDPARADEALRSIVPENRRKFFNMRRAIAMIVDRDSMFEMSRQYGPGQVTMLARLNGYPVGIFSNDSRFYAGAMTADGARKARRFTEFCETFNLPIVSFVDEPGFMIGSRAEQEGAIRAGTAAVLAAATCRSPWASVIVRKSYGVAAAAHYGPGVYILGWPSAEMGALPLEGGVAVAFGREIAAAEDPEAKRAEIEARMSATLSPARRAESFSMHELIDPCETRAMLCEWIEWNQQRLETQCGPSRFAIRP